VQGGVTLTIAPNTSAPAPPREHLSHPAQDSAETKPKRKHSANTGQLSFPTPWVSDPPRQWASWVNAVVRLAHRSPQISKSSTKSDNKAAARAMHLGRHEANSNRITLFSS
jgi:hypothetical protein